MAPTIQSEQKVRRAIRTSFSKTCRRIEGLLSSDEEARDMKELSSLFELLEIRYVEMHAKDAVINTLLAESTTATEEDLEAEQEHIDEYSVKYFKLKRDVSEVLSNSMAKDNVLDDRDSLHASSVNSSKNARKYKLPQLKLKEFDGELGNWLSFWSQFEKIDRDPDLDPSDKYQYLFMATKPGSIARKVVESYPGTDDMYDLVTKALKDRFGRVDLLTEFYIRELLSMIINNAMSSVKMSVSALYDKLQCHLRNLNTLGITNENCAPIIHPLVVSCLPPDLLKVWERDCVPSIKRNKPDAGSKEFLPNLIDFLRVEVESEQKVTLAASKFGMEHDDQRSLKAKGHRRDPRPTASQHDGMIPSAAGLLSTAKNGKEECIFCSNSHRSQDCGKALSMNVEERRKIVNEKRACFCCLLLNHSAKYCRNRPRCIVCGKPHFPILCNQYAKPTEASVTNPNSSALCNNVEITKSMTNFASCKVFLQTLVVLVEGNGFSYKARALLDSASQRSYIVSDLAKKVGYISQRQEFVQHALFGGVSTGVVKHGVFKVFLSSIDNAYRCNFDALDQEKICDGVSPISQGPWIQELSKEKILLSDVNSTGPIEILLGADIAGKLITGNVKPLKAGPVAIETLLGWTLMGKISGCDHNEENVAMLVTNMLTKDISIADLWSLDVLGISDPSERQTKADMDLQTQKHFEETVSVNEEGRFVVHLPWISDHPALPSNYGISWKRLQTTVKRLKNEGYYEAYDQILEDWLTDGIIEEVTPDRGQTPGHHYLPHRHVVKLNSSTTPVRPVFDGSAHECGFPSLNQCLHKGPNLIEKIPSVLAQFRKKKIGVVGDIRKAFLQISIAERDRNVLRFFWLDKFGKLKVYRHCRVVFGISSSPFLLEASIKLHLENVQNQCKAGNSSWKIEIVEQLIRSFYVDNCVTSCDNESQAQSFIVDASNILMERLFELRGWELTNSEINFLTPTNVLGLLWNRKADTLSVNLESLTSMVIENTTKKTMLSAAHRLFDPIGFTCPVALIPKLLIQQVWTLGIGWDEEVPNDIDEKFKKWIKEIKYLENLNIPRWIYQSDVPNEKLSLHVFSDACITSYAAVIFLRVQLEESVNVQLIAAKSRVAPIGGSAKKMTIPRLELLGASIAARLYQTVKLDFGFENVMTSFYTDASTVLAWIIRHEPWDVFVSNRIKEIRDLTAGCEWKHIPGTENPADVPSRGTTAKKLVDLRWWEGPDWLRLSPEFWPRSEVEFNEQEIKAERKKSVVSSMFCCNTERGWFYRYFSQHTKIVRLIGWISRFKKNALCKPGDRIHQDLTKKEFEEAQWKAVYLVQQESFEGVSDPKLSSLLPYVDELGIIRLRTKVSNRDDFPDFCNPAVLPSTDHPFVHRLVNHVHIECCHAGTQFVLSQLRQQFWVLGGRRSIRKVINSCQRCKRYLAKHAETEPSPLPPNRVRFAKVFEITGVDLAGPLFLKTNSGHIKKHWICLFTCGVYRASHLELLSSPSTESFLLALRRFMSRRGRPQTIYSDQGTNFIGADNAFKKVDWNLIHQYSSVRRIEWRFNPPSSPWWGGWWERLIGLLKNLLRRILGRSSVTYEEMATILCDCEAIINSRPLTYLSQDSQDLAPLTPGMFLQDVEEVGNADLDLIESTDLCKRFKYRQELKQVLCRRFRDEYLGQLKLLANHSKKRELQIGEIVLIGNDCSKRLDWPLARITDLIKGADGHIRLARVRTAKGELVRPLQRLYPLELDITAQETDQQSFADNLRESLKEPQVEDRSPSPLLETSQECDFRTTRRGRLIRKPQKFNL